jgi:hypothetical protein
MASRKRALPLSHSPSFAIGRDRWFPPRFHKSRHAGHVASKIVGAAQTACRSQNGSHQKQTPRHSRVAGREWAHLGSNQVYRFAVSRRYWSPSSENGLSRIRVRRELNGTDGAGGESSQRKSQFVARSATEARCRLAGQHAADERPPGDRTDDAVDRYSESILEASNSRLRLRTEDPVDLKALRGIA